MIYLQRILIVSPVRGVIFPIYLILSLLLLVISISYFKDLLVYAGFPPGLGYALAVEISFLSLALSPVNVVVKEFKTPAIVPEYDVVYIFGFPVYLPKLERTYLTTLLAFNLGGAVIPLLLSLTLLYLSPGKLLILLDVVVIIVVSKLFSRVVNGVGVVMNPLIAPIFSVLVSYILFFHQPILIPLSAYVSSVIGTLVGADLLNIRKILEARPQVISVGGMGTFDGIFISGLLSIFLGQLLISL
ncbi:protein of unknown function DUF1614 [Metallosphaera sedula]|uniref:DUF1614 domain-containing protein n=2 Tax=Metallosphaera sedula TaxID=43687 RepID=A4YE83_METS5|nr:DUF1614 domain-containing protein [Metallosphaera sedula]ABP94735.1 protein of unknown function DUF1614 [Metallosphaera sedula DSM 5348]AIM26722.1 protein of unknown function DUF1614 [Metallosphaera sedula]